MSQAEILKVALAQIAPVWLHKQATLEKIEGCVSAASKEEASLIVFGEALLPGYPFWVEKTDGAVFESKIQKEIYSHYVQHSVCIEHGDLDPICQMAKSGNISIYLGIIERPKDRGDSLYCSLVYINQKGNIDSVHRKVVPTYEERLVWSAGDGNGLITHRLGAFTVGGLNCWENWLPLARTALTAQGEDLHISVWPGNERNTRDLIPMIAKESRSYVIGVSGLFDESLLSEQLPHYQLMKNRMRGTLANGGTCVAAPDGSWLLEPVVNEEGIFYVSLDHARVREERLMMNGVGHYSRPDIFQLSVDTTRQSILKKKA
ncbi:MAG: carbon-nitrogen hydrolase family protein [Cyclobacteriaceae bacterium]